MYYIILFQRRLSLGSESSDSSTPSPKEKLTGSEATPLTSLTNKPKRLLVGSGRRGFSSLLSDDQENKENIPCRDSLSPKKRTISKLAASPNGKSLQKLHSPGKVFSRLNSPGKRASPTMSPGKRLPGRKPSPLKEHNVVDKISPVKRSFSKRPIFQVLEDETDDTNSRDSGYNSQNLDDMLFPKKQFSPIKANMADILQNCSPDKEEGITPLKSSPDRTDKEPLSDGFDFVSLETISEDQENESPRFDLNSLLSNKMYLPAQQQEQEPPELSLNVKDAALVKPIPERKLSLGSRIGFRRPTIRRAMSMIDRPMESEFDSPVSRHTDYGLLPNFKRPEPPRNEEEDNASKRRKFDASSLERSEEGERRKPKFYRSHSENEVTIMKSCHRLYEVDNILPDGSR